MVALSGVDHRDQSPVGHSRMEAEVGHGEDGTGVEVRVREGGKAAVDPYKDFTRASVSRKGGSNIKVLNDDNIVTLWIRTRHSLPCGAAIFQMAKGKWA